MWGDRLARAVLVPLLVVLALTILVFYILFTTAVVDGPSMRPSLESGDRLLVTRSYDDPARGDVILFTGTDSFGRSEKLIKRVVGLPGDMIQVVEGVAVVNGVAEPDTTRLILSGTESGMGPVQVPQGMLFVMGDNRPVSLDSRYIGPVPLSQVHGQVVWRFLPLMRTGPIR